MNNLTRQLNIQAVQLVADSSTQGDISRLNINSRYVQDLINQKFAELLIKEFLNICKDTQTSFLMYGMNDREADGAAAVQKNLEEHFGLN